MVAATLPVASLVGWLLLARPSSAGGWGLVIIVTFLVGVFIAIMLARLQDKSLGGALAGGLAAVTLMAAIIPVFQAADGPLNAGSQVTTTSSHAEPPPSQPPSSGSSRTSASTPDLRLTVSRGAQAAFTYSFPIDANKFPRPPSGKGKDGCATPERHYWAISHGGLPAGTQSVFVTVEATRDDTYVKIGDLKVRSRRLPGRYTTMFAPCPKDIKPEGAPKAASSG